MDVYGIYSYLSKHCEPVQQAVKGQGAHLQAQNRPFAEVDGLDEIRADTRLEGTERERIVKPIDQSRFQLPLQGTDD